jgi:predicted DNA-binding WGR domain protein
MIRGAHWITVAAMCAAAFGGRQRDVEQLGSRERATGGEQVRRFEYIQGNQAKFWEVSRKGAVLTVSSGKIGGSSKTRTKQLGDFMAAEQEFDRLIRDKIRRGYVEVEEASEPEPPLPDRQLQLQAREDDTVVLDLKPAATRYVVWRMVEIGVMDKQAESPDLGRWTYRASRRLRLEEVPASGSETYDDYREMYLGLSEGDRAAETGDHGIVGAYKLAQGSDWIVTAKEAGILAEASRNRAPKRHKITTNQQRWLDEWIAFNDKAAGLGGYDVHLVEERPA